MTSGQKGQNAVTSVSSSKSNSSRCLTVRGIRYVRPYTAFQCYSVRLPNVGQTAARVLANAFHRQSNDLCDTLSYFQRAIWEGRVSLRRHKKHINDTGPYTSRTFTTLLDPDCITEKNDQFQLLQHVHERCTIDRGGPLLTLPLFENDSYLAVFKPAGLSVVSDQVGDGVATLSGLLIEQQKGGEKDGQSLVIGHRLDLPVSGVILLGKGKKNANRIVKAIRPECKVKYGVLKAYIALVKGGRNKEELVDGKVVELKVKLAWDNRAKKAVVCADENGNSKNGGRDTITRVSRIRWDAQSDKSLVRVELATGARQQIRAVLAFMGLPIIGDVKYGGGEYIYQEEAGAVQQEECRLYEDDDQGSLQQMLQSEQKQWCDKCRWQLAEAQSGGTTRGTERLAEYICLLSYHYRIPSLGIDACVPHEQMPCWAK